MTVDTKSHVVPLLDLSPYRKYTGDPEGLMAPHINSEKESDGFGAEDEDISSPINITKAKKTGMTRLYSANVDE